ncbi:phospholipase D family protein [Xanthobacter autotrophicus]|uniref:phospholipase D family protein n=1 Tax=Xanthobacter autotrophicus TaxID=280 RepID=UPI00372AA8E1
MSEPRAWRGQPYLDELHPPPGWSVDLALFATYSLDLSALGATLLALCGRNDDNGSGSIADFAEALETLRGNTRFLVQRGRIARPSRLPTLAGVLDQFVIEVPHDEERLSWHPKAALVRYVRKEENKRDETIWRYWMGSRNLTRSADLDAGLLIETTSKRRRGARPVDGIDRVFELLAARSGLTMIDVPTIRTELAKARWLSPDGIVVERIDSAFDGAPMRALPARDRLGVLTIVSPFLDATFLRRAAALGGVDTVRTLVSTRHALAAIAQGTRSPLARFDRLLAMDAPTLPLDVEPDNSDATRQTVSADDDVDPQPPSLHAKLYCFEHGDKATLLMGSANATARAWDGRNTELLAELSGGVELTEGLKQLVGSAMKVTIAEMEQAAPATPGVRDELEILRRQIVASWSPRLLRDGQAFRVEIDPPSLVMPDGTSFHVGLAATELSPWPKAGTRLALGEVPSSRHTDLLRCELRAKGAAIGWMQRAPVSPPLDNDRDAVALASLMGFGAFQTWMRQLLSGDPVRDDGARWDQADEDADRLARGVDLDLLMLEDIVGSWGADKCRFKRADAHFDRYCAALLSQPDLLDAKDHVALDELRAIWSLARDRLPA